MSLTSEFYSGFELEAAFAFLPNLPSVTSQFSKIFQEWHPVGESGPVGHSLMSLICATAALKQFANAAIYESAFDEAVAPMGVDHPEVLALKKNLQDAGYLIAHYQKDTFCVGLDPTTSTLTEKNKNYYADDPQRNIYNNNTVCGIEINGPVENCPFELSKSFENMTKALSDIGINVPITCGIHQHIDVGKWRAKQLAAFCIIDSFFDRALRDHFFPEHRKNSQFCAALDTYLSPPQDVSRLVFLSDSINNYSSFLHKTYPKGDRLDLLVKMAEHIQANMFPSRENNHAFKVFVDSYKNGNLNQEFENIILLLRRQRYYQTNFEAVTFPGRHTVEKRWMPATLDAKLTELYFVINYLMVKNSEAFSEAKIVYDEKEARHFLLLKDQHGRGFRFGDSLDDLIAYLNFDAQGRVSHRFSQGLFQDTISNARYITSKVLDIKDIVFPKNNSTQKNHVDEGISRGLINHAIQTAQDPEKWKQPDADELFPQSPTSFYVTDAAYQEKVDKITATYRRVERAMTEGTSPEELALQSAHLSSVVAER